jgi:hypothetical protein
MRGGKSLLIAQTGAALGLAWQSFGIHTDDDPAQPARASSASSA